MKLKVNYVRGTALVQLCWSNVSKHQYPSIQEHSSLLCDVKGYKQGRIEQNV